MDKADVIQIIQFAKESAVEKLDLSNKGITELPNEIGLLTNLKLLDLSYNEIEEIPESICNLKNLEAVYLLRNNVSKLPAEIGQLGKLKKLDISYNPIVKLPQGLGGCSDLDFLDASYCELRSLPIELNQLYNLKTLNLEENPLEFPPQKVVKRGLYAIMHYLGLEKKKKDASKIMLQTFNMPDKLKGVFRDYISYFNQMINAANGKELQIDLNFVNQDFYQEMEINSDVEGYLFDIMRYIQQRLEQVKLNHTDDQLKEIYIESRMSEIKEQLFRFNQSLDEKIEEIQQMKKNLNSIFNLLD